MPYHRRFVYARRVDEPNHVGHQFINGIRLDTNRFIAKVIASPIGCPYSVPRPSQRVDLRPPAIPELRKAVQQNDEWPRWRPRLYDVQTNLIYCNESHTLFLIRVPMLPHPTPQRWLINWVFLPVLSYVISIRMGLIGIGLYPILLPVVQWYALKQHPANRQPAYWFVLFVLLYLANHAVLQGHPPPLRTDIPVSLIYAFYLSQCLAELVLYKMVNKWQFGWFTAANGIACFIWYQLFLAQDENALAYSETLAPRSQWLFGNHWYYLTIPAVAIVTNLITGLGLRQATQANGHDQSRL